GGRPPGRIAMEAIGGNAKLAATVSVKSGRHRCIPFDEIQATVTGADGVLVVDPITGRMGMGTIAGQARIALPPGKPASVETGLYLSGHAVESVCQALGVEDLPLTCIGKLVATISGTQ